LRVQDIETNLIFVPDIRILPKSMLAFPKPRTTQKKIGRSEIYIVIAAHILR
jgi:hypothetical protein